MVPLQPAIGRSEIALRAEIEVFTALVEGWRRGIVPAIGDHFILTRSHIINMDAAH